jgi:hypothetical protein
MYSQALQLQNQTVYHLSILAFMYIHTQIRPFTNKMRYFWKKINVWLRDCEQPCGKDRKFLRCVCVCVCIHLCMHACMWAERDCEQPEAKARTFLRRVYVCMYVCMHACMYAFHIILHSFTVKLCVINIFSFVLVQLYARVYAYTHEFVYVCMYI